jgi:hypothetical protein
MAAPYEVLQEYLVGLGFKIDKPGFDQFKRVLDDVSRFAHEKTSGMASNYVKAASLIVGALASVTTATVGLMDKIAQADLGYQKFALRMYMANDVAKQLKITTDALGESISDIAWLPELRDRYFSLMSQAKGMETPGDAQGQLKQLRDIRFEFTRMKVEAVYAFQWIGYYMFKYLSGPLGGIQEGLKKFNDFIQDKMPRWTDTIAKWMSIVLNLGKTGIRVFSELFDALKRVWEILPQVGKEIAILGGVVAAVWFAGPMGRAVIVLSTLILLIDDFYAYLDGRKSSQRLAPIWGALMVWAHEFSELLKPVLDGIKWVMGKTGILDESSKSTGSTKYAGMIGKYFSADQVPVMESILKAESSGRANAVNGLPDGRQHRGLFQISSLHTSGLIASGIIRNEDDLYDPETNVRAAKWVYDRQGLGAWTASKNVWGKAVNNYRAAQQGSAGMSLASSHGSSTINLDVGGIVVNVPNTTATAEDIANLTVSKIEALRDMAITRDIREFQGITP